MRPSHGNADDGAGDDPDHPSDLHLVARTLAAIEGLPRAETADQAITLLADAMQALGGTSATFLCFTRDDALLSSFRCLHVGHPAWPLDYAQAHRFTDDPWMKYALHESEPVLGEKIVAGNELQRSFVAQAQRLGYASSLIVPAPSPHGQSRVGVLCLGAETPGAFERHLATRRLLARSLAMELHAWVRRAVRTELLHRSHLSQDDLELLRHELAGRGSKAIGALMNLEGKTIDCRFQRVCAKLGVPNRRAAVRVALLYGLL